MRIAVNTRFLLKDKLEGIGWFTYETTKRMVENNPQHEFVFLFDRPYDSSYLFRDNVEGVNLFPPARHPFLWYTWFEWSIPRLLKKKGIDIFFSPDGYMSLSTKVPTCITMHDLAFEHYPEDVSGLVSKYYNHYTPKFAHAADRIVTVSEFTKQDIVNQYGVDQEKIDVAYNGVNKLFESIDINHQQAVKEKYSSGTPYFVYVGALHPRKNIARLFLAFDAFKKKSQSPTKLVIVGRKAWGVAEIEEAYEGMEYKSDVVFTGRLSSEELHRVIASAQAMTYVPYFEGFGIPIIEAQKCGIPVITSDRTSMPEVAGNTALLVDPFHVDSISHAMLQMDGNEKLRRKLTDLGSINVERFSWDNTAKDVWESLMKLA